ncbi:MAG TPA: hypothetical protein DDZ89_18565, partial [Clostridiales bacterium]|nr:hypothetical protein [Clostridiales bacterium]
MKYVIVILLIWMLTYLLSFAYHTSKTKNYLAAIGSVLIGFAAFGFMFYMLFFGSFKFINFCAN